MTDPKHPLQSYVRAALIVQGYTFSEEKAAEITIQFARIAAIADTILPEAATLADQPDPGTAPVFRP